MPAVPMLERYVRERRDTDRPLINWLLYLLLTGLTCGIYGFVILYRRFDRVDLFSARRQGYYTAVLGFTAEYAEQTSQVDSVHHDLDDMRSYLKDRFTVVHSPVKAGQAVVLSVVTLGIYALVTYYRVMRYWWEIQVTEQDLCERLARTWTTLGITRYPVVFEPTQVVRRSFWTEFFLTLGTFGIYGFVWDYHLHTDPDRVYPEFHTVEDQVLTIARNAAV